MCAVVVVQWVVIVHRRATHTGDFDVSREFGRRFLAGEDLYAGGLHYPYMPTAALSFSPLRRSIRPSGLALRYAAALGCLWLTLRLLHTMLRARRRGRRGAGSRDRRADRRCWRRTTSSATSTTVART